MIRISLGELPRPFGRSFLGRLIREHCRNPYSPGAVHSSTTPYPVQGFRSYFFQHIDRTIDIRIPHSSTGFADIESSVPPILFSHDSTLGAGLRCIGFLNLLVHDPIIQTLGLQLLFEEPKGEVLEALISFSPEVDPVFNAF